MRPLVAAAVLGLVALPSFASAEMPATIRGVVYACDTGAPIPNADVWITAVGGGSHTALVTDTQGGFARVGLAPGRYLVIIVGWIHNSTTIAVRGASRLATVDTDDVLDVRIGTQIVPYPPSSPGLKVIGRATAAPFYRQPIPICDAAVVPPAQPTSDRYVIH